MKFPKASMLAVLAAASLFVVQPAVAAGKDRAQVVRDTYAAFMARDKDKMRQLIAPDVRWYTNNSEGKGGHGPMQGIEAFFETAFGHIPGFKSWNVRALYVLTDGNVVMTRQQDDVVRNDGTTDSYLFNNYYEFNDKDQISAVWEVTSSARPFE